MGDGEAETKRFSLRTLLSVTTGRLLTKGEGPRDNGIGDIYKLLGWMTSDEPFTHQLGRFGEECKPWLLRWFPELSQAVNDDLDLAMSGPAGKVAGVEQWLLDLQTIAGLRPEYDVPRIPADDHERKDPIDELVAMRGTDEGIIVVKP